MAIQFFLFDWSGTISDDRHPVYQANILMRRDFGIAQSPTFEQWAGGVALSVSEAFAELGVTASADEIDRVYRKRLNEVIADGTGPRVYPDAAEVLERLARAGKTMFVLSSHPSGNLEREARAYGLDGFFEAIVGDSRDKTYDLKKLVKRHGLDPQRAIYTGDTVHDIRHTKRAGLLSAGITTGYHSRASIEAEEPDYIFTSLSDVQTLL